MKRNPRKVKWTKAYRRLHGKDMTQDTTFEFERKRNRVEKYNRNLQQQTLKVMPGISKLRHARKHIEKRSRPNKVRIRERERNELLQNSDLIKAPAALRFDSSLTRPKIKISSKSQLEDNRAMEE